MGENISKGVSAQPVRSPLSGPAWANYSVSQKTQTATINIT